MKALTLTQPWATLVAIGAKRIETRSWRTLYRGAMAIHAAKGFPVAAKALCKSNPFHAALYNAGFATRSFSSELPRGAVLATCRLISCLPTRELHNRRLIEVDPVANSHDFHLTEQELAFGDYSLGRWAWLLADVKALPEPIPTKGALSLWEWAA